MYVHLGENISIPMDSIITMVHAKQKQSKKTAIQHYDADIMYIVPEEDVKTYIVTDSIVYGSGISLKTLNKRISEFYDLLKPNR